MLGAQQNRVFDRSVLVPAAARLEVSASCVEQGRWDNRRHREPMQPSPQAADPSLRHRKRDAIDRHGYSDQGEVWAHVAGRLAGHGVASPSAAMSDVYDGRPGDLADLSRAVRHGASSRAEQCDLRGARHSASLQQCWGRLARMLFMYSPAGMKGMFAEIASPGRRGTQPPPLSASDLEALTSVAAKYRFPIVAD